MFKNITLFLLFLTSIVLLIFTFMYLILVKSQQADVAKYYKSTDRQLNDITSISEEILWSKSEVKNLNELFLLRDCIRKF